MANEPTLKAGAVIFTLFWLAIGAAWCYLFVYIGEKKRRHIKGRVVAIEVHVEIAVVLLWVLLTYLAAPFLEPSDAAQRVIYFGSGALILEASCFVYASIKYFNAARHKYSYLVNYAYCFGGSGMFVSGLSWLIGYPTPVAFAAIMVGIATAILVATEVWFLARNEWHFLPHDPR